MEGVIQSRTGQIAKNLGMITGIIGQFAVGYFPTYAGIITFTMLILVLAFRPQGILGRKQ